MLRRLTSIVVAHLAVVCAAVVLPWSAGRADAATERIAVEAEQLDQSITALQAEGFRGGGARLDELGDNAGALEMFNKALASDLALRRQLEAGATIDAETRANLDRSEAADRLWIAAELMQLKRFEEAVAQYETVLPLLRRIDDVPAERVALSSLGRVLVTLGRFELAERCFLRALELDRAAGDEASAAADLNNLGVVYRAQGRFDSALSSYQAALEIRRRLGDRQGEANNLANLGSLHLDIGDRERGLGYSRQALDIHRALGDRESQSADLNNIATALDMEGKNEEALAAYRQALDIDRQRGDRRAEANALENIGTLLNRSGQAAAAEAHLRQALAIYEDADDAWGRAHVRLNLAVVLASSGQYAAALDVLARALPLADAAANPETAWRIRSALRMILDKLERRPAAIYFGKEAVNIIQGMRQNATGLERASQRSLVDSRRWAYEDLADLLIEEGRLVEAQRVLGMLKEEEYFQYIQRDLAADPRQTTISLTPRELRWEAEFADLRRATQAQDAASRPQADSFARWVSSLNAGPDAAQAESAGEVSANGVIAPGFTQANLSSLGAGAVVVHYLVTEDRVRILLTTPSQRIARTSVLRRSELNQRIFKFRTLLQNPALDPRPAGKALYDVLVQPIAADLQRAGARVLMLYLDESLRYLPFAALHDGTRWLAESYSVTIFTPVSADRLMRPVRADWRVAGLGTSRSMENFPALCAVPAELYGIVQAERGPESNPDCAQSSPAPGLNGALPGDVVLDARFTRGALADALARGYPVLHVASHFVFKAGTAADSFLLLGDGGHLTLESVRKDPQFDFGTVDLLTLSACETAVAEGMDIDGSEVEGLGALAQRRGASAVLATLWPVADASTGVFMRDFYALRQSRSLTKAEALRQAQLSLIHGKSSIGTAVAAANRGAARDVNAATGIGGAPPWPADPAAPFAHPFFWAPFILMGNWR